MNVLRIDRCPYGFNVFCERNISDHAIGFTVHLALGRFGFYQQQHLNLRVALDGSEWRIRKCLRDCSKESENDEFTIGLRGDYTTDLLFELLGSILFLCQKELGIDIRWRENLEDIRSKVVFFPVSKKKV